MIREFIFTWYKNEKYGKPIERKTKIKSVDAQSATDVFMRVNGNLVKNTIVEIQEIDEEGNPIGEPIKPM